MKNSIKVLLIMNIFMFIFLPVSICSSQETKISTQNQIVSMFDNADAISIPTNNSRNIKGALITLAQVGLLVISLIIGTVSIIKLFYCMVKLRILQKDDENYEKNREELARKIKKAKKNLGFSFIIGFILFSTSGILQISKSFKPIIYIYPKNDNTNVSITLSKPERITCSYPKYNDGWNVVVNKDGTITDGNRYYYALYWEGLINKKDFTDGFVVKGKNTAEFLEEKLKILGLTDKEAEEFIVYWLPKMENNRYNLIRFLEEDELNEEMELNIFPKPDTLIRIQMQYKPLLFYTDIPEQSLEEIERKGFTIVEWGGSKV